ncbi:MAG: hypothetical protein ABSF03_33250 [Streptosporangiaceae bacterium]
MTGQQTGDGQATGHGPRIAHDCGREPNPQYGLLDRIAVALFPILQGRPDPDREAGA